MNYVQYIILVACSPAPPSPLECVDIPCTSALSSPSDSWVACEAQEAVCELPQPVVCVADASNCICRHNKNGTVTALCTVRK